MSTTRISRALDGEYSDSELEKLFMASEYKVHSIKVNSLYHSVGNKRLVELSTKYNVPLFYDLKLYDTPNTVYDTIHKLPKEVKYLTVTHAHYNHASLRAAAKAAKDVSIKLFVVSVLTSADISSTYLEAEYCSMCSFVEILNNKYEDDIGVVIPTKYIHIAKRFSLTTLTPGLVIDTKQLSSYINQVSTGTISAAINKGGDIFVLGRNFPKNKEELDYLNEVME